MKAIYGLAVLGVLLIAMATTLEFTQKPRPLPIPHRPQIVWTCENHPTIADC